MMVPIKLLYPNSIYWIRRSSIVKNNTIGIVFLVISLCLFISVIILTNDNIKEKIEVSKLIPIVVVVSIMLVLVILLWKRRNRL